MGIVDVQQGSREQGETDVAANLDDTPQGIGRFAGDAGTVLIPVDETGRNQCRRENDDDQRAETDQELLHRAHPLLHVYPRFSLPMVQRTGRSANRC